MGKITKTSIDEIKYDALSAPDSIKLSTKSYSLHSDLLSDGFVFHQIYACCEDLRKALLPMDSNPREPANNAQVSKIKDTLVDFPQLFHKRNNGITIVCDTVKYDSESGECEIVFGDGQGICNGGHTYFAIVTTPGISNEALVHLELIQLPEELTWPDTTDVEQAKKRAIVDIARYRNNNIKLKTQSEADFQGYYGIFKEKLIDSKVVSWHENDSSAIRNAISSEHFIRLLAALDPAWFKHEIFNKTGDVHTTAATSVASIHNAWYETTEPILVDIKPKVPPKDGN